jgi:hypothetical protein
LRSGGVVGAGVVTALFALIFGIRKFTQDFSVTKKPQSRAASA